MLTNPRIGQLVQVWYGPKAAPVMPHHGRIGRVVSRGRWPGRKPHLGPVNHGIEIDGQVVFVPCGNLRLPRE